MRHRAISLRAVPVALARLDMRDVADGYLPLFLFRRDRTPAGCRPIPLQQDFVERFDDDNIIACLSV